MSAGRHPYFSSAISWHRRLDEALADARAQGKRVFVQHGHQKCAGSRALVERTLNKEEIVEFLSQHFVGLASDSNAAEPDVAALVAALPRREPTPVCIYLTIDARVLLSTAGGRPPAVLLNDMMGTVYHKQVVGS